MKKNNFLRENLTIIIISFLIILSLLFLSLGIYYGVEHDKGKEITFFVLAILISTFTSIFLKMKSIIKNLKIEKSKDKEVFNKKYKKEKNYEQDTFYEIVEMKNNWDHQELNENLNNIK